MKKNWLQITTGIIIAILIAFIFYGEGGLILQYIFNTTSEVVLFVSSCLIGLFTYRWIWKRINNKMSLSNFYLYSILVSLVFVILVMWMVGSIFGRYFLKNISVESLSAFFNTNLGIFISYNLVFLISIFFTGLFGVIFTLLTRRKVRYIEYISREVKKMEQEGLKYSLTIYENDELAELSLSINHMAEALLQKEKKEKQLITNISHDLRSPMTAILGYVDLLKQNGTTNADKFNEYIEVVDRRLHRLNEMINELFLLSKLSESDVKLNMKRHDITLLLRQLAQENEILLQQSELGLKTHIPEIHIYMEVDAEKIARAIQNLFENARKYAIKHTAVGLVVELAKNQLIIELSNQFDPLHKPDINKMFDRFYKLDESRTDTDSSGLGLAIVKRIVKLHGGIVVAQAIEDTIFIRIKLPILRV